MTNWEPVPGSRWQHWKGNYYEVLCCAVDERTLQRGVVYRSVTDLSKVWFRILHDFLGQITYTNSAGELVRQSRFTEEIS